MIFRILTLMLIPLLISSCNKNNCESVQVGSIQMHETSEAYLSYEHGEKIVFTNTTGDSLIFFNEIVSEGYNICIDYYCTPLDPYKPSPCEYYKTKGIRNILRCTNDTLVIEMLVSVQNYTAKKTDFYDQFSLNFSGIGSFTKGEKITFIHFDNPPEDITTIISEPFNTLPVLSFMDESFEDVLETTEGNTRIYYKKGMGVIGFILNNEPWLIIKK